MSRWHLGIVGGCLSHQEDIPLRQLYHQQLAARLQHEHGRRLVVHLARGFEQDPHQRLEDLLQKQPLDGVLLQLRMYSYSRRVPLIVWRQASAERLHYHLHPFLFAPWRSGWAEAEARGFPGAPLLFRRHRSLEADRTAPASALDAAPAEVPVAASLPSSLTLPSPLRARLRGLAYRAGRWMGLEAWALREERRTLELLHQRCRQLQLPLLVMGPTRHLGHPQIDRCCRTLQASATQWLQEWGVPYCPLPAVANAAGEPVYGADGIHLTGAGHAYVAEKVFESLDSLNLPLSGVPFRRFGRGH